ncbi:MAG TPA: hypothetical protein VFC92_13655 [Bacteroidales bacterium]|nr:hypothetical protein [Bacteroidales bacterium]
MSDDKKSVIGKLLDDLTHIEINTIIKKGMTSAPQPDSIEEKLRVLLSDYIEKLASIIRRNDLPMDFQLKGKTVSIRCAEIKSYEKLYADLDALDDYMSLNHIRIEEKDYVIIIRMKSFCNYLRSRSSDMLFTQSKNLASDVNLYSVDMDRCADFKIKINDRDKVMITRVFDLGTERIVMQTRIGIDGDIITRIEQDFAGMPKQVVLDAHDKHTNLALKYWQDIINVVKDIVSSKLSKKNV